MYKRQVQTMTTDGNGYAKSAALVAGTYYVKEITAPKGYVLSGKVHTLTVKAGQTTGISATDKEQLGACLLYTSLYTGRYRSLEDWRVPTCLALSIAM